MYDAIVPWPSACAPSLLAVVLIPSAWDALSPEAVVPTPSAWEFLPEAFVCCPSAWEL